MQNPQGLLCLVHAFFGFSQVVKNVMNAIGGIDLENLKPPLCELI